MSRATILSLFLVSLIFQSGTCIWQPKVSKKEQVCKTTTCSMRGIEYFDNMDPKVDPCQDFFSFACGKWSKNHKGPTYAPEWTVVDLMHHDLMAKIKSIFESDQIKQTELRFSQAKMVYDTCMKITRMPMRNTEDTANTIYDIGRFPATKLWDLHDSYLRLTGESAFFNYKILGHRPSEGIPVLMIMEPTSAYGSILHDSTWSPAESKAYTDFLFMIIKSLRFKDSDATIKERIEKVFKFRKDLDRVIHRNRGEKPDRFMPATRSEFQMWFDQNIKRMSKTQDIHWMEVVNTLLRHLSWDIIQHRTIVAMRRKSYFTELLELMRNVPEDVLAGHMEIYFIERHLRLENDRMVQLLEATSDKNTNLLRYVREKYNSRWQNCIEDHNMVEVLEQMLFEKWFVRESQENVDKLIDNIKLAMEQQMKASTWLNRATFIDTKRRLDELEQWVGFPTWYTRRSIPVERDTSTILTPNASLNIRRRLLNIHITLMQPPLYSPNIPLMYNYGGLGTTIGHELYHLMNDCGVYQDGDRTVTWWPAEMRMKCLTKKFCFVEEYNKVTNREFKNRYGLQVKADSSITYSENFPDVMGLEAAFIAYQQVVKKDKTACQVLPQFKDFSCNQMFFITFANSFCGAHTQKKAKDQLDYGIHSIDSVRINGAVSQMTAFRDAFACPAGSLMNPATKCNLWK